MTNTSYTPKMNAIEAKAVIDQMMIATGLSMIELAKANGCNSGYELMKKIISGK